MCGRFYLDASPEEIAARFGISSVPSLAARYNIAPSQSVAAVRMIDTDKELVFLRWGLVPSWAKQEKTQYSMINARAETVATKPAYRSAYRHRRCIIPATGFYEWKNLDGRKQPYCIRNQDESLLPLAGLWERWDNPEGGTIESCAIIVTEANSEMREIHDRMPVILRDHDFSRWLDPDYSDVQQLDAMLRPYGDGELYTYPISTYVNKPAHDDRDCIAPLARD